jgi:hypothetical protein
MLDRLHSGIHLRGKELESYLLKDNNFLLDKLCKTYHNLLIKIITYMAPGEENWPGPQGIGAEN